MREETLEWHQIGADDAVPRLGARVVETAQGRVAVFRDGTGAVRAIDDACPHRGGPLSEGIVAGTEVSCPLHGMCISLIDGRAIEPDEGEVRVHPVRVVGGVIHLGLVPGARRAAGACSAVREAR
ncbi:MAG: nitrite reductase small subunit NirD [Sandaracinaceae bacterium]|nr:nitrite reductase small subunit NirD [Sandaracinaceae bacterium]